MNSHQKLEQHIRTLLGSDINLLVVRGNHGLGKSHSIMEGLAGVGFKRNVEYMYISGYTTPLQLFNILGGSETLEDPRLIIFDDVDSIVRNKVSVALLKAALWEVEGKRIVSYHSSSPHVNGPGSIEFTGKIIIVLNDMRQERYLGRPLLDRGILYDMTLPTSEVIAYIERILPTLDTKLTEADRQIVWGKVKRFASNPAFSIRSLLRAMEFYRLAPKNWLGLYTSTLSLTDEQKIMYATLDTPETTVSEDVESYMKRTGKSRASFFRLKKSLKVAKK